HLRFLRENKQEISFSTKKFGLVELAEVCPDFLKFDMKLIQKIDTAPASRQQFLASLVKMVAELGVHPLAEGVETKAEHQVCEQIGFTHGQGYYYGRPAPGNSFAPVELK
ncbi:MAG: EAL domain-containing protein, partial [Planctomycetota bacterium]|nr:EAL domain-containing protein [Planctomycetota bacterium]